MHWPLLLHLGASVVVSGVLLFIVVLRFFYCGGFLRSSGSRVLRLTCSWHVGFLDQDSIHIPCVVWQIPNSWTKQKSKWI